MMNEMRLTAALLRLRQRERWKPAENPGTTETDGQEPHQTEYQSINSNKYGKEIKRRFRKHVLRRPL